MEIKYNEWARINYDLYGVFFDKFDCATLFKLTNLINNHNFNPSLVDKIFIPRNEYNNRKDIEKFDFSQLKQKIYEIEIDRIIDAKDSLSNESNYLKICKPTETLKQVGLDDNLITMKRGKVRICCKDKEQGGHGINRQTLYNLPKLFENPAIIMKSQKDEKSIIVFLNDIDNEKNPIMASIKPDEKGTYDFEQIDTNLLTSIYGRENFSKFLNDNKDKILFTDELVIKGLEVKTSMKIFNKENENLLEQQQ